MATENKISILVSAVDQASKVLKNVWGSITDFAKKNEKSFESMRNIGAVAFTGIAAYAWVAVKAFAESQEQMARVGATLKNIDYKRVGGSLEEATKKAKEFGDTMEKSVGLSWEQGAESFAKLLQVTGDYTEATKAATLANDLAIAKGIDNATATKAMAMAMQGNVRALKEFGIEVEEGASKTEILGLIQEKVGGQSLEFAKTLAGRSAIMREAFGNMQESIGGALTPALEKLLSTIQPIIEKFTSWAEKNPELLSKIILIGGAIAGLSVVIGTLGLALPAIVTGFWLLIWPIGLIIAGIVALGIAWQTNFMDIQWITHKVFDEIKAFWEVWGADILKGFENIWETVKIATTLAFELIGIIFTEWFAILWGSFDIFKGIFTGNWSLMWEGLKTILSATWNAMKLIISTIGTAINTYVKTIFGVDIAQNFKAIWESVYTTATDVFTRVSNYISEKIDWIMAKLRQARDALLEIATLWGANTASYNGARAVGGYTSPNTPYLVGERWPEIFVPTGSGRVIPNSQLGGGQSVNISFGNVSISNGMELEDLTNKIKSVIYNEHKFARLWY